MAKGDTIDLTEKAQRATMEKVVVDKVKLLDKLEDNRDKHRAVFLEAMAGYKAKVLELLEAQIERVKNNAVEQVFINIPMPSDHTDDYDRIIETLKWTLFDEVTLTIQEFDMYVRDSWGWKQQWTASNSVYAQSLQAPQ